MQAFYCSFGKEPSSKPVFLSLQNSLWSMLVIIAIISRCSVSLSFKNGWFIAIALQAHTGYDRISPGFSDNRAIPVAVVPPTSARELNEPPGSTSYLFSIFSWLLNNPHHLSSVPHSTSFQLPFMLWPRPFQVFFSALRLANSLSCSAANTFW